MTDLRELRDEVLSRMAEGPIHTRYHAVNEALVERQARRAAAAKARRRA
ncbi:hypothetical protein ACIQW5_26590 [Methylorubrum thiocyanatum]